MQIDSSSLLQQKAPEPIPPPSKPSNDLRAAQDHMKKTLESLKNSMQCGFCKGKGHNSRECMSKFKLDRIAKQNKSWKAAWGYLKSKHKQKNVIEACRKGAYGRKRDI